MIFMAVIDFEFRKLKEDGLEDLTLEKLEEVLFDFGLEIDAYDKESDILKIEITAERTDLLSFNGFKRALKAYLLKEDYNDFILNKSDLKVYVEKSAIEYGNYTMCAVIKNLKLNSEKIKEIINVQEKLHLTYGRKRKSVAIGVYPLDKINFPIYFKADVPKKINFIPLGEEKQMNALEIINENPTGKEYAHLLEGKSKFLYFKDSKENILSMPPIINSSQTGKVQEDTTDLFIECTGSNLKKLKKMMNILSCLFSDFGGEVYSLEIIYPDMVITSPDVLKDKISCSLKSINKTIGVKFKKEDVKPLLKKMMIYDVNFLDDDKFEVNAPIYRTDILHENDIADDIARAYTFSKINPTFSPVNFSGERLKDSIIQEEVVNSMVSMGFIEVLPFSLSSIKENFENFNLKKEKYIPLGFSAESSLNMVGTWILPKLFKSLTNNQHRSFPQKLFSCDYIVLENKKSDTLSENKLSLAAVISNSKVSFTEISSYLLSLFNVFGKKLILKPKDYPFYIKGRSASVFIDDLEIGHIGEFSIDVLKKHSYFIPVCGFEIDVVF